MPTLPSRTPVCFCVYLSVLHNFLSLGLSERREWLWLEIWLVWMFFILHQLQLATFLSWNIVIFPSMQINLKDNNIETAGGSSDPRPRVPLFATWIGLSNIRQGTKQLSILHLEGKPAPLVIIRFPTKVSSKKLTDVVGWARGAFTVSEQVSQSHF